MTESLSTNYTDRRQREELKAQQIADLSGRPLEPIQIGSFPPSIIPEFYGYTTEELVEMSKEVGRDSIEATDPSRVEFSLYSTNRSSLEVPGDEKTIVIGSDELKVISNVDSEVSEFDTIESRYDNRLRIMRTLVSLSPSIGSEQLNGRLVAHFASEYARSNMRNLLFTVAEAEKWTGDDFRRVLLALDSRLMTDSKSDDKVDEVRDNWIKYTKLVGKYSLDMLKVVRVRRKY